MKLMTKEVERAMPEMGSTENVPPEQKKAIVKFFSPEGRGTWYAVEGERMTGGWTFFGYVVSPLGPDCDEWGYFSLAELEKVRTPQLRLPIERDRHFEIGSVIPELQR